MPPSQPLIFTVYALFRNLSTVAWLRQAPCWLPFDCCNQWITNWRLFKESILREVLLRYNSCSQRLDTLVCIMLKICDYLIIALIWSSHFKAITTAISCTFRIPHLTLCDCDTRTSLSFFCKENLSHKISMNLVALLEQVCWISYVQDRLLDCQGCYGMWALCGMGALTSKITSENMLKNILNQTGNQ